MQNYISNQHKNLLMIYPSPQYLLLLSVCCLLVSFVIPLHFFYLNSEHLVGSPLTTGDNPLIGNCFPVHAFSAWKKMYIIPIRNSINKKKCHKKLTTLMWLRKNSTYRTQVYIHWDVTILMWQFSDSCGYNFLICITLSSSEITCVTLQKIIVIENSNQ